jgi:predicted MPP superfamily phosphohydrolase/ADP-ribose pyrophosphatase YjhB (NUDIX family)
MITYQGAGAIVAADDGRVLLVRAERRGMRRWELPAAIRKSGESLFLTAYRCVEQESGFSFRVRIGRPVCVALNTSRLLGSSYFAMFFECEAVGTGGQRRETEDIHADLPASAKQRTLDCQFVSWQELHPREIHPQHRAILEHWTNNREGNVFSVESDADQELEFFSEEDGQAPSIAIHENHVEAHPPRTVPVELKWIHVSDIHFGGNSNRSKAEKLMVLEALVEDVRSRFQDDPVDCIFVTGDIAYSAQPEQYRESFAWIQQLASASGVGLDRVWLVPGNHDVQRDVAERTPELETLHSDARANPAMLDDSLANPQSLELMESKLQSYSTWVREEFPHIVTPLDWSTSRRTESSKTVAIAGLCTVWVSDEDDGAPNLPGTWSNNMFVSRDRSLSCLKESQRSADLIVLLTHHPRSWLCYRSTGWLETMFRDRTVVHLSGHVHEESACVSVSFSANGQYAAIVAGAVHAGDGRRHGYSWGQLCCEQRRGCWHLGWAPRVWTRGGFTADRTNYETLDDNGYAWETLRC